MDKAKRDPFHGIRFLIAYETHVCNLDHAVADYLSRNSDKLLSENVIIKNIGFNKIYPFMSKLKNGCETEIYCINSH